MGNRIDALTILGGDYGLSGGSISSSLPNAFQPGRNTQVSLNVQKFGGAGDIGDPRPIGSSALRWQPRVEGNMGFLGSTDRLHSPLLEGDISRFRDFAIQFGGGARFWLGDQFSFAQTLMGMYGHASNAYTANSPFMRTNLPLAVHMGLVGWNVDTWTVRPALNLQYAACVHRSIITFSIDPTYFHTESFASSNPGVRTNGDSGSLT